MFCRLWLYLAETGLQNRLKMLCLPSMKAYEEILDFLKIGFGPLGLFWAHASVLSSSLSSRVINLGFCLPWTGIGFGRLQPALGSGGRRWWFTYLPPPVFEGKRSGWVPFLSKSLRFPYANTAGSRSTFLLSLIYSRLNCSFLEFLLETRQAGLRWPQLRQVFRCQRRKLPDSWAPK